MKKYSLLLFALLMLQRLVDAQSYYPLAGLGVHPGGPEVDSSCWNCAYDYGSWSNDSREIKTSPGYSFYLGYGNDIRVAEHWKFQTSAKLQFMETPINKKTWTYDKQSANDLVFFQNYHNKYRHLNLQLDLALERNINLKQREWSVFGGGFLRIKIHDWVGGRSTGTQYFTDLDVQSVYDSMQDVYHTVLVSKRKLEEPITVSTASSFFGGFRGSSDESRKPIQIGILGGVSFPIASLTKWQMRGQATIAHDIDLTFRDHYEIPSYHQTYLMVGLSLKPNTSDDNDFSFRSTTGKKIPLKGFQSGASQHELFFSSLNLGYLTGHKFGVDLSVRSPIIWETEAVTAFIGPVYQIGDSRFLAKGGAEFLFLGDDFDDESGESSNFRVLPYIGAKYLLPITTNFGLHTELGVYPVSIGVLPFLPSLGVGFVIAPFGVK